MTEEDIQKIVQNVRERLVRKNLETGLELELAEQQYEEEENWLFLTIRPLKEGVRPYDYVETLDDVEKELRKQDIKDVYLLPELDI